MWPQGQRFSLGLMLGDYKPPGGKVVYLSFFNVVRVPIAEGATTSFAYLHPVDLRVIGCGDHLERMPRMSGLSAGLSLPFPAQAFGRGFLQAIR